MIVLSSPPWALKVPRFSHEHHQFTQLAPKSIVDNMVECILREQKFEPNICLQGGLMFAISMFLVLKNEQHEY
jgi:hypothetical protein